MGTTKNRRVHAGNRYPIFCRRNHGERAVTELLKTYIQIYSTYYYLYEKIILPNCGPPFWKHAKRNTFYVSKRSLNMHVIQTYRFIFVLFSKLLFVNFRRVLWLRPILRTINIYLHLFYLSRYNTF